MVLNVGTAHLGVFGGKEAIAKAKGELVEALPRDGRRRAQRRRPAGARDGRAHRRPGSRCSAAPRARPYGAEDVTRRRARAAPRSRCAPRRAPRPSRLRLYGAHAVANALAAAAAALRARPAGRRHRRGAVGGRAAQPLADGGHRPPRRGHRGQRRLQRQPRVDAGRLRRARHMLGGGRRRFAVIAALRELGEDSAALQRGDRAAWRGARRPGGPDRRRRRRRRPCSKARRAGGAGMDAGSRSRSTDPRPARTSCTCRRAAAAAEWPAAAAGRRRAGQGAACGRAGAGRRGCCSRGDAPVTEHHHRRRRWR